MVFFPVDLAIALTSVVHFFNNLYKVSLVGRNADKKVLVRFGIPAIAFAFLGAWILIQIPDMNPLFDYHLFRRIWTVSPIKLIISIILIVLASWDLIPQVQNLEFNQDKLPIGGALSGALRSAFLIIAGLSNEVFIGSAVVVSTFVDFTRLGVYATRFSAVGFIDNIALVLSATVSAISGAYFGNKLLKKVTLRFLQITVAVMLILLSVALGAGFI